MHGIGCVKFPEEGANSDNLRCHKTVFFFFLLQVSEMQMFQYRIHTNCKRRFNSYFAWVSEVFFPCNSIIEVSTFLDQNFFLIISRFVTSL